jgi:hypothetical protein
MVKKKEYIWASYADLMTSLFFVMLVLFVLVVVMLKKRQISIENELERYKQVVQLEQLFEPLENDPSFVYLPECKKYVSKELLGHEIFDPGKTVIKPEFIEPTIVFGMKLQSFIRDLNGVNPDFIVSDYS